MLNRHQKMQPACIMKIVVTKKGQTISKAKKNKEYKSNITSKLVDQKFLKTKIPIYKNKHAINVNINYKQVFPKTEVNNCIQEYKYEIKYQDERQITWPLEVIPCETSSIVEDNFVEKFSNSLFRIDSNDTITELYDDEIVKDSKNSVVKDLYVANARSFSCSALTINAQKSFIVNYFTKSYPLLRISKFKKTKEEKPSNYQTAIGIKPEEKKFKDKLKSILSQAKKIKLKKNSKKVISQNIESDFKPSSYKVYDLNKYIDGNSINDATTSLENTENSVDLSSKSLKKLSVDNQNFESKVSQLLTIYSDINKNTDVCKSSCSNYLIPNTSSIESFKSYHHTFYPETSASSNPETDSSNLSSPKNPDFSINIDKFISTFHGASTSSPFEKTKLLNSDSLDLSTHIQNEYSRIKSLNSEEFINLPTIPEKNSEYFHQSLNSSIPILKYGQSTNNELMNLDVDFSTNRLLESDDKAENLFYDNKPSRARSKQRNFDLLNMFYCNLPSSSNPCDPKIAKSIKQKSSRNPITPRCNCSKSDQSLYHKCLSNRVNPKTNDSETCKSRNNTIPSQNEQNPNEKFFLNNSNTSNYQNISNQKNNGLYTSKRCLVYHLYPKYFGPSIDESILLMMEQLKKVVSSQYNARKDYYSEDKSETKNQTIIGELLNTYSEWAKLPSKSNPLNIISSLLNFNPNVSHANHPIQISTNEPCISQKCLSSKKSNSFNKSKKWNGTKVIKKSKTSSKRLNECKQNRVGSKKLKKSRNWDNNANSILKECKNINKYNNSNKLKNIPKLQNSLNCQKITLKSELDNKNGICSEQKPKSSFDSHSLKKWIKQEYENIESDMKKKDAFSNVVCGKKCLLRKSILCLLTELLKRKEIMEKNTNKNTGHKTKTCRRNKTKDTVICRCKIGKSAGNGNNVQKQIMNPKLILCPQETCRASKNKQVLRKNHYICVNEYSSDSEMYDQPSPNLLLNPIKIPLNKFCSNKNNSIENEDYMHCDEIDKNFESTCSCKTKLGTESNRLITEAIEHIKPTTNGKPNPNNQNIVEASTEVPFIKKKFKTQSTQYNVNDSCLHTGCLNVAKTIQKYKDKPSYSREPSKFEYRKQPEAQSYNNKPNLNNQNIVEASTEFPFIKKKFKTQSTQYNVNDSCEYTGCLNVTKTIQKYKDKPSYSSKPSKFEYRQQPEEQSYIRDKNFSPESVIKNIGCQNNDCKCKPICHCMCNHRRQERALINKDEINSFSHNFKSTCDYEFQKQSSAQNDNKIVNKKTNQFIDDYKCTCDYKYKNQLCKQNDRQNVNKRSTNKFIDDYKCTCEHEHQKSINTNNNGSTFGDLNDISTYSQTTCCNCKSTYLSQQGKKLDNINNDTKARSDAFIVQSLFNECKYTLPFDYVPEESKQSSTLNNENATSANSQANYCKCKSKHICVSEESINDIKSNTDAPFPHVMCQVCKCKLPCKCVLEKSNEFITLSKENINSCFKTDLMPLEKQCCNRKEHPKQDDSKLYFVSNDNLKKKNITTNQCNVLEKVSFSNDHTYNQKVKITEKNQQSINVDNISVKEKGQILQFSKTEDNQTTNFCGDSKIHLSQIITKNPDLIDENINKNEKIIIKDVSGTINTDVLSLETNMTNINKAIALDNASKGKNEDKSDQVTQFNTVNTKQQNYNNDDKISCLNEISISDKMSQPATTKNINQHKNDLTQNEKTQSIIKKNIPKPIYDSTFTKNKTSTSVKESFFPKTKRISSTQTKKVIQLPTNINFHKNKKQCKSKIPILTHIDEIYGEKNSLVNVVNNNSSQISDIQSKSNLLTTDEFKYGYNKENSKLNEHSINTINKFEEIVKPKNESKTYSDRTTIIDGTLTNNSYATKESFQLTVPLKTDQNLSEIQHGGNYCNQNVVETQYVESDYNQNLQSVTSIGQNSQKLDSRLINTGYIVTNYMESNVALCPLLINKREIPKSLLKFHYFGSCLTEYQESIPNNCLLKSYSNNLKTNAPLTNITFINRSNQNESKIQQQNSENFNIIEFYPRLNKPQKLHFYLPELNIHEKFKLPNSKKLSLEMKSLPFKNENNPLNLSCQNNSKGFQISEICRHKNISVQTSCINIESTIHKEFKNNSSPNLKINSHILSLHYCKGCTETDGNKLTTIDERDKQTSLMKAINEHEQQTYNIKNKYGTKSNEYESKVCSPPRISYKGTETVNNDHRPRIYGSKNISIQNNQKSSIKNFQEEKIKPLLFERNTYTSQTCLLKHKSVQTYYVLPNLQSSECKRKPLETKIPKISLLRCNSLQTNYLATVSKFQEQKCKLNNTEYTSEKCFCKNNPLQTNYVHTNYTQTLLETNEQTQEGYFCANKILKTYSTSIDSIDEKSNASILQTEEYKTTLGVKDQTLNKLAVPNLDKESSSYLCANYLIPKNKTSEYKLKQSVGCSIDDKIQIDNETSAIIIPTFSVSCETEMVQNQSIGINLKDFLGLNDTNKEFKHQRDRTLTMCSCGTQSIPVIGEPIHSSIELENVPFIKKSKCSQSVQTLDCQFKSLTNKSNQNENKQFLIIPSTSKSNISTKLPIENYNTQDGYSSNFVTRKSINPKKNEGNEKLQSEQYTLSNILHLTKTCHPDYEYEKPKYFPNFSDHITSKNTNLSNKFTSQDLGSICSLCCTVNTKPEILNKEYKLSEPILENMSESNYATSVQCITVQKHNRKKFVPESLTHSYTHPDICECKNSKLFCKYIRFSSEFPVPLSLSRYSDLSCPYMKSECIANFEEGLKYSASKSNCTANTVRLNEKEYNTQKLAEHDCDGEPSLKYQTCAQSSDCSRPNNNYHYHTNYKSSNSFTKTQEYSIYTERQTDKWKKDKECSSPKLSNSNQLNCPKFVREYQINKNSSLYSKQNIDSESKSNSNLPKCDENINDTSSTTCFEKSDCLCHEQQTRGRKLRSNINTADSSKFAYYKYSTESNCPKLPGLGETRSENTDCSVIQNFSNVNANHSRKKISTAIKDAIEKYSESSYSKNTSVNCNDNDENNQNLPLKEKYKSTFDSGLNITPNRLYSETRCQSREKTVSACSNSCQNCTSSCCKNNPKNKKWIPSNETCTCTCNRESECLSKTDRSNTLNPKKYENNNCTYSTDKPTVKSYNKVYSPKRDSSKYHEIVKCSYTNAKKTYDSSSTSNITLCLSDSSNESSDNEVSVYYKPSTSNKTYSNNSQVECKLKKAEENEYISVPTIKHRKITQRDDCNERIKNSKLKSEIESKCLKSRKVNFNPSTPTTEIFKLETENQLSFNKMSTICEKYAIVRISDYNDYRKYEFLEAPAKMPYSFSKNPRDIFVVKKKDTKSGIF